VVVLVVTLVEVVLKMVKQVDPVVEEVVELFLVDVVQQETLPLQVQLKVVQVGNHLMDLLLLVVVEVVEQLLLEETQQMLKVEMEVQEHLTIF
tara:strand:- start:151 stop:429 length:279 start_codon:yes stop_codon:yes gene_type:complete